MKKILALVFCLQNLAAFSQNDVGIGTTDPVARLHVKTNASEVIRVQGVDPYVSLYNAAGEYRGYFWNSNLGIELGSASGSNLPVIIAPNFNVRATFLPNGNVGIGTMTPTQKLEVLGNIASSTAVTAPVHNFPSPKTYFYSISEAEVVKRNESLIIDRAITGGGIVISGGTGSLMAPVHLPHGATVTRLTVYYYDASVLNMQVSLRSNNTSTVMATAISTGASGEGTAFDATIVNALINNNSNAYVLDISTVTSFWPDYSMIFRKAVIEYTVSSL